MAANRRRRLFAAMVALAGERGYHAIRVADLIELAGISRGAFYEQFAGKEECLTSAVDELLTAIRGAVAQALAGDGPLEQRVPAAIDALVTPVVRYPAAAEICLVDAYGAGAGPAERAERGLTELQELLSSALAESPERAGLPADAVRGLIGGIRSVVLDRLRHERASELPALVPQLAAWLLAYRDPPAALRHPRSGPSEAAARFAPRDQAERVLIGVCGAVAERGYAAAGIADVARHAAMSIRTFYAHFETKEEAYLAALDLVHSHAYAAAASAARRAPDWPHAVRNGLRATCGFFAAEPAMARAALVEAYAAGAPALAHRDDAVRAFAGALEPGRRSAGELPAIAGEAIAGAVDALLFEAARRGDANDLHALAPTATFLALAPFTGEDAATTVANDAGQPRRRRP